MSSVCYSPLGRLVDVADLSVHTSRWTGPLVMSEEANFLNGLYVWKAYRGSQDPLEVLGETEGESSSQPFYK